jgi:hypothetical protein
LEFGGAKVLDWCSLEFALLEALLEPWRSFEEPKRSFEELWGSFEDFEAIWSLEVHKSGLVLFGGILKHWMCNPTL